MGRNLEHQFDEIFKQAMADIKKNVIPRTPEERSKKISQAVADEGVSICNEMRPILKQFLIKNALAKELV